MLLYSKKTKLCQKNVDFIFLDKNYTNINSFTCSTNIRTKNKNTKCVQGEVLMWHIKA